jgi:hypothetical protein
VSYLPSNCSMSTTRVYICSAVCNSLPIYLDARVYLPVYIRSIIGFPSQDGRSIGRRTAGIEYNRAALCFSITTYAGGLQY